MAESATADQSPPIRLNVGCGRNIIPGWVNLDSADLPGVNIRADLDQCATIPIPMQDNSVDEFLLSHVIEHIRNTLPLMQELHRIAKPGAKMVIEAPHGGNDDAWDDPTHVKAYFAHSFGYFSQPYYRKADYGYRGDWQPTKITFYVKKSIYGGMSRAEVLEHERKYRNVVIVMRAELTAVKPARTPQSGDTTDPEIEVVLVSNS